MRLASSTSVRLQSVANVSPIGPSFTCIVASQFESLTVSSSLAPGMHGMIRGTSMRRAQAFSGGASTWNEFSSFKRAPPGVWVWVSA